MKKMTLLILLCLPAALPAQQGKPPATMDELLELVGQIVREDHMTGLMLGVTTRDSVLFSRGFGYADLQAKRPVTGKTLLRMGSITKSFVAIGILRLVEQGKISLTERLKDIAPELPFENPWESLAPVRIINLLEHTTGFDDMHLDQMYSLDRKDYSSAEMMRFQARSMTCRWPPGEKETYCNVNYVILGYLIRKITGREYGKYLQEQVLAPLAMSHTNFDLYPKDTSYDAKEYVAPGGRVQQIPSVTVLTGPAASLWSSADDMLKFLQCLLKKGKPLLSESSMLQIETPQSSLAARSGLLSGYAKGNEDGHYYNKYPWRGHEGTVGACNSVYLYNRILGLGFIISCNGNSSIQRIEYLVADFLERSIPDPSLAAAPASSETKNLTAWAGLYQSGAPRYELFAFLDMFSLLTVETNGHEMSVSQMGRRSKLISTGAACFRHENANTPTIIFTRNHSGHPVMIYDGVYFQPVNPIFAYGKIVIACLVLLLAAGSFILALTGLVQFMKQKIRALKLLVLLLPAIATTVLAWTVLSFSKIFAEGYLLYQLREVSPRSLTIFVGTSLYGLLTVIECLLFFKSKSAWDLTFTKRYTLLTVLSMSTLTIMMACTGFLGIRTWAM